MIEHKTFDNGFKYIEIQNKFAKAKIALQGAHVFEYEVFNKPALLWLSDKAYFEKGKAIRGGIPLCFPWFGKHPSDNSLPQHGFARTALWELAHEEELEDGSRDVRLKLSESPQTLALWNYKFEVHLDVFVGKSLSIGLHISNTDSKAFEVSTALHTYFNVTDISDIHITGLDNTKYYDALTQSTYTQKDTLHIDVEVDRVYQIGSKVIQLKDREHSTTLETKGSSSVVVWNPWKQKSIAMADMNDEGYESMVCLETSNAGEDRRVIEVGQTHTLEVISVQNIFDNSAL